MKLFLNPDYLIKDEDDQNYYVLFIPELISYSQDSANVLEVKDLSTLDTFSKFSAVIKSTWKKDLNSHLDRVKNADMQYPILFYKNQIIDGYHRLMKAFILGEKTIKTLHLKSIPKLKSFKKTDVY